MRIFKASECIPESRKYTSSDCAEARFHTTHAHDFYEIAYVYENAGWHYTPHKTEPVKTGNFLFISPGIQHCTFSPKDESVPMVRVRNCLFDAEYFDNAINKFLSDDAFEDTALYALFQQKKPFCLCLSDDKQLSVKNCIMSIKSECEWGNHSFDKVIGNLIENFLAHTSRIYDIQLGKSAPVIKQNPRIHNLIHYMRMNLDLPLTLDLLAKQVNLSPEYLSRYFKSHMKKNIWEYLTEMRMAKAKFLLVHTQHPVTEICCMCGYPSVSNFRRVFNKMFGISPHKYRKEASLR